MKSCGGLFMRAAVLVNIKIETFSQNKRKLKLFEINIFLCYLAAAKLSLLSIFLFFLLLLFSIKALVDHEFIAITRSLLCL